MELPIEFFVSAAAFAGFASCHRRRESNNDSRWSEEACFCGIDDR
jgi:hypothetical protein